MTLSSQAYQPPSSSSWSGRADTVAGRIFQQMQLLDIRHLPPSLPEKSVLLLGFASDEGVKRNLGRIGAAQGPDSLREALTNTPLSFNASSQLWDAGTILCSDGDLEKAQTVLATTVASLRERGAFVIILGGGHEMAWGNFQGLLKACAKSSTSGVDVLNFDAHFDLRSLLPQNKGSSGTSFYQIQNYCQQQQVFSSYACFGIQPFANTQDIFETARLLSVTHCFAETMIHHPSLAHEALETWLSSAQQIHLTLCLDIFAAAYAPGVSSPQALGMTPHDLLPFFRQALESGKVVGFDIAELNPLYDRDNQTANLAASFVAEVIETNLR